MLWWCTLALALTPREPLPPAPTALPSVSAASATVGPARLVVKLRDGQRASAVPGTTLRPLVHHDVSALIARAEERSGRAQPDYGSLYEVVAAPGAMQGQAAPDVLPLTVPLERLRVGGFGRGKTREDIVGYGVGAVGDVEGSEHAVSCGMHEGGSKETQDPCTLTQVGVGALAGLRPVPNEEKGRPRSGVPPRLWRRRGGGCGRGAVRALP